MKIYQKKNTILKSKSYNKPQIFDAYLDYVVDEVYNYPPLKDQLKANIENLFWTENSDIDNNFYNGLVAYGEVQSGKTANMLAATTYAYDLGFRYVFILTGNIENLHNQTRERFKNEITKFNDYISKISWETLPVDYPLRIIHEKNLGKKLLIQMRNLQTISNVGNLLSDPSLKSNLNVFFSLKNSSNYEKIIEILKNTQFNRGRNSVLILDDEADWGNKSNLVLDSEANRLYKQLLLMKKLAIKSNLFYLKYIGFTATPYKLLENDQSLVQDFKNNIVLLKSKTIEPWMNEKHILENEPFYAGINIFLGQNKTSKYQTEILNSALNRKFVTEVDDNYIEEEWLLKLSLYLFLINAYLFKETSNQFNGKKAIHGLYFADIYQNRHSDQFDTLVNLIPSIKSEVLNLIEQIDTLTPLDWEKNKHHHISRLINIIINEYDSALIPLQRLLETKFNGMALATLKNTMQFIKSWLNESLLNPEKFIVKMSGEESEENKFNNKKFDGYLNACFIIGGYKIARGVTFDNLVYECLVKSSDQYDSTLQRARWLGYRSLDLLSTMDLVLSRSVIESFNQTIKFDAEVREAVQRIQKQIL